MKEEAEKKRKSWPERVRTGEKGRKKVDVLSVSSRMQASASRNEVKKKSSKSKRS